MFRWLAVAILLGAVATSGYYRRRARIGGETIARRREGNLAMALRFAGALLLFLPVVINAAMPERMTWASFALPSWARWLDTGVGLAAIPAVAWVLGSLGRNVSETILTKQDHQLVTAGPYRWIRHPLYTTAIVMFLALGLMQASLLVLVVAIAAAFLMRWLVIPAEERELAAKFGDRYRVYMTRTGRFLPMVRHLEAW